MSFQRIEPDKNLSHLIECYWVVKNEEAAIRREKIIPDGFTEIIFHLGDPYRIQLNNTWETQERSLLAGQINKYFFLENTGVSNILAVKFKPTALTHLFNLDMHEYTNRVIDIRSIKSIEINNLEKLLRTTAVTEEQIQILNTYFKNLSAGLNDLDTPVDRAVNLIFEKNGMLTVMEIGEAARIGERQLEHLFKRYIGLSPKLFTRIIRFNYIFQLQERKEQSWAGLAYDAAFYDQSHFIRNFKNFTGVSPASYLFDENNMANFFLKKK